MKIPPKISSSSFQMEIISERNATSESPKEGKCFGIAKAIAELLVIGVITLGAFRLGGYFADSFSANVSSNPLSAGEFTQYNLLQSLDTFTKSTEESCQNILQSALQVSRMTDVFNLQPWEEREVLSNAFCHTIFRENFEDVLYGQSAIF